MDSLLSLLFDYTFIIVALGSMFLGLLSGMMGCFSMLQRKSLLGDCISHAALPGVVIAFMVTGTKHTEVLLLGAMISGVLATLCIVNITTYSILKFDSILAMVLASFFGLGLVLLTVIQKSGNANQAGIERFIYGQASGMLARDVCLIGVCLVIILCIVLLFYKEFKIVCFDVMFAGVLGINIKIISFILTVCIVITIVVGLQTVGVILMSAMLISPAVAARQWVHSLKAMIVLSMLFGGISGVFGTMCSSLIQGMPTGPMIVLVSSCIVCISLLFAPSRGIVYTWFYRNKGDY